MANDRASRLVQTLVGVYGFYDRELTEFAIRVWADALRDVDLAAIGEAFDRHLCDPDAGRFLPKPADILRQLVGNEDDAALVAWGKVLHAVRSGGARDFDGPTHDALQSLGGISVVGRTQEHENGFLQKRFIDAFKAYKRRAEAPPLLLGSEVARQPRPQHRLKGPRCP